MKEAARILIVDDEENMLKILRAMLEGEGYTVLTAQNLSSARERIVHHAPDVVLTDLRLGHEDGLSLLKWIKDEEYSQPVIILTAHGTVDSAVDAMKQGAFDYLLKPFERKELVGVIQKAVRTFDYQSHHAVRSSRRGSPREIPIIGKNEKIQKIRHLVEKVAPTDSTVLITGESGTGKELIAEMIHRLSSRNKGPFIKINCAAIPETLMESELFGYERGAFTGAVGSKPGRFELADVGTLFLDEIGEMSTEMQVKLLRVLQDKCFERVGGIRTIRSDVRLVTATNKNLDLEVKEGRFRSDLFYRLNVVPVVLPPLRERPDDIADLVQHFVHKYADRLKKVVPTVDPEALDLLIQFPWPGNIRQLENIVERTVVMQEGPAITAENLPQEILDYEESLFPGENKDPSAGLSLKEQVKEVTKKLERRMIEEALEKTSNNVTHAARLLNLSRKGLQMKIKELGLRN